MTLLIMDGFDLYTDNAMFNQKNGWDSGYDSYLSISPTYSRFGTGNGLRLNNSDYSYPSVTLVANKSTVYMGMAIKKVREGTPTYNSSERPLIGFLDENGLSQVKIHVNNQYGIQAHNSANTLLGSTADNVVPGFRWFYLEIKVTISATVGEVTVRVNGTEVLNLTNQDTKNVSDYIRKIIFSAIHPDKTIYMDDFYADDAEFHGDVQVRTFYPDADSATHTDFVRSTGSNDYECVDESPPTEDTDYIYANGVGDISVFGITTGVLGSSVKAIQLNNRIRIDQAGVRTIKPLIRSNGSDYQGTETAEISADYYFESEIFRTDPDDSNPWTQTKLEAAEFGLEIIS